MPVYLSLLICALSGNACHVAMPVDQPFAGIAACQQAGMMMGPQWEDDHPGWRIRLIRCSMGNPPQLDEGT